MQTEREPQYSRMQDAPVRRRSAQPQEKVPHRSPLQRVIFAQLLLCSLLSLSVFLLYKTDAGGFQRFATAYSALFGTDMEQEAVVETFRQIRDFVLKPPKIEPVTDAGAGGEDLLYPEENSSFSPYTITGAFHTPVAYTRVTSPFGYRKNPVTDVYGFHSGIDLAAKSGTPIFAAFAGRVVEASVSPVRGKYVILEHGDGVRTVYCHCSTLLVEAGMHLRSGEKIAEVGATGQATGPHLHFEVWIGGKRCNPAWLLGLV